MLIQALWDNYANVPIQKWARSTFLKLQLNCFFKKKMKIHFKLTLKQVLNTTVWSENTESKCEQTYAVFQTDSHKQQVTYTHELLIIWYLQLCHLTNSSAHDVCRTKSSQRQTTHSCWILCIETCSSEYHMGIQESINGVFASENESF